MIRNGFRQPKKAEIKKHNEMYMKAIKATIGKEHLLIAEGVIAWCMKLTDDYLKLDVGFVPAVMEYFNNIKKYGDKLLELTRLDIECIPLEYASQLTKDKLRSFAKNTYGKGKDYKYTAEELGILERDYLFFQQIDICWDILDKELCKDKKYTDEQIEALKMFRRYCRKIVKFFNEEVESDMINRGLIA